LLERGTDVLEEVDIDLGEDLLVVVEDQKALLVLEVVVDLEGEVVAQVLAHQLDRVVVELLEELEVKDVDTVLEHLMVDQYLGQRVGQLRLPNALLAEQVHCLGVSQVAQYRDDVLLPPIKEFRRIEFAYIVGRERRADVLELPPCQPGLQQAVALLVLRKEQGTLAQRLKVARFVADRITGDLREFRYHANLRQPKGRIISLVISNKEAHEQPGEGLHAQVS